MATETKIQDYQSKQIELIERLAAKAFAEHQIVELYSSDCGGFACWRCAKPGTGIYAFTITIKPGTLIITGDLGSLVVERCSDMIAWCRGSINSIDYFAEKVDRDITIREWSKDVANEWIDEQISEHDPDAGLGLEEIEHLRFYLDDGQPFFEIQLHESELVDGCDWPDFTAYTGGFLWRREAIKWFLDQLETV